MSGTRRLLVWIVLAATVPALSACSWFAEKQRADGFRKEDIKKGL